MAQFSFDLKPGDVYIIFHSKEMIVDLGNDIQYECTLVCDLLMDRPFKVNLTKDRVGYYHRKNKFEFLSRKLK